MSKLFKLGGLTTFLTNLEARGESKGNHSGGFKCLHKGKYFTFILVTTPYFSPYFPSILPLFLSFSLSPSLFSRPCSDYHMLPSLLLFAMTLTLPRAESPLFIISTHCDLLARLTRDSDATHLDSLYAPFPLTHSLSVVYINPVNYF